jgi:hypothetical protein
MSDADRQFLYPDHSIRLGYHTEEELMDEYKEEENQN